MQNTNDLDPLPFPPIDYQMRTVNGPLPREQHWPQRRLLCAVNAYVRDGLLRETVLDRAACPPTSTPSRARIPTAHFKRSEAAWKRCTSGNLMGRKLADVVGEDAAGAGQEAETVALAIRTDELPQDRTPNEHHNI
jgi:hypothetical protein